MRDARASRDQRRVLDDDRRRRPGLHVAAPYFNSGRDIPGFLRDRA
jgi:hypothetical protein